MATVEYCDVCGQEARTANSFIARGVFMDTSPPFGAFTHWTLCSDCTMYTRTFLEKRTREIGVTPPKRRLFGIRIKTR